jgi:hypothetical protein
MSDVIKYPLSAAIELSEQLDNMQDQRDLAMKVIKRLERERDEAQESLKHITEYGTEEINAAVELRQKLAQTLVERDEAREQNVKLRNIADTAIEYVGHTSVQQKLRSELKQELMQKQ